MGTFAGLTGAAGATDGLEQLLARRMQEAKMAEAMRAQQVQEGHQTRQLDEQTRLREMTIAENNRQAQEREGDRRHGRLMQEAQLMTAMPMGTSVQPQDVEHLMTELPSMRSFFEETPEQVTDTQTPEGYTTTVKAPGYRFLGKQADATKLEVERQRGEDRDADRMTRVALAQLAASAAADRSMRNVTYQDPNGQNVTSIVNANGETVFSGNSQLPGGQKNKLSEIDSLLAQIGTIEDLGTRTQWGGVGAVSAPIGSLIKRTTGRGSDSDDVLRGAIDSIMADIAHEKYGSAFTNTEKSMLASFAPKSGMHHSAIKNRFVILKNVLGLRRQELSQGATPDTATPLKLMPNAGAPSGTGRATGAGPGPRQPVRVGAFTVEFP